MDTEQRLTFFGRERLEQLVKKHLGEDDLLHFTTDYFSGLHTYTALNKKSRYVSCIVGGSGEDDYDYLQDLASNYKKKFGRESIGGFFWRDV